MAPPVLAVQEDAVAMVLAAVVAALASLLNTALLKRQEREVRPGNGTTLAGLLQRTADKVLEIDSKVDRLDVRVAELGGALAEHVNQPEHASRREVR